VVVSSEASLLDAAQRLAEAERRADLRVLEELMAEDYQGHDPVGRPQDRAGVVQAYAEGGVRVTALGQSDLRVRVIGEVGLVVGVSAYEGRHGAQPFGFRLRFLDVYAWRDGRWQLIASQDTHLPR
jgi:ketosteroid isomerase-like protein